MPRENRATTVDGTDGDLEDQERKRNEKQGDKVWNEELEAVVVVYDRGETEQVSESNSTAHGAEDELDAVAEHVAAILALFRLGRELQQDSFSRVHVALTRVHVRVYKKELMTPSRASGSMNLPKGQVAGCRESRFSREPCNKRAWYITSAGDGTRCSTAPCVSKAQASPSPSNRPPSFYNQH